MGENITGVRFLFFSFHQSFLKRKTTQKLGVSANFSMKIHPGSMVIIMLHVIMWIFSLGVQVKISRLPKQIASND
jgi:hypothetical protein